MVFGTDGFFHEISNAEVAHRLNEKTELKLWEYDQNVYAKKLISFVTVWESFEKILIKRGEENGVIAAAINGYLSVNRDPHTYILPLKMYEEVVAAKESRQISLGFIVKREVKYLLVRKVFEGSPVYLAGIRQGDRIVKLNDHDVEGLLPSKVTDILRLRQDNRLAITIQRNGLKKYFEVLKSEVIYPSVVGRMMNNTSQAGLLTIHRFSKETCSLAREQIMKFIEQGARGLVLDLRDNPGGQVDEAACVVNLFIERGIKMFETRYFRSNRTPDIYISERDPIYKGSIAVLVNSGSASASEIVAGALKDLRRATLVGEKTFGKGSFQDGKYWSANSKVAFFETEGLYYFPSGWTPQLVGIDPDIKIEFNNVDHQREADIYSRPLLPKTKVAFLPLDFISNQPCDVELKEAELASQSEQNEDPQSLRAQALLSCGARYGNNGSL